MTVRPIDINKESLESQCEVKVERSVNIIALLIIKDSFKVHARDWVRCIYVNKPSTQQKVKFPAVTYLGKFLFSLPFM